MKDVKRKDYRLMIGDCLDRMKDIPDGSIDLVLTDPPYGTTACAWDAVIPFDKMWRHLRRVAREDSPIILFGSEPFSTYLRMSNIDNYKYDMYWEKPLPTGHLNAKIRPTKHIENISVFFEKQGTFNRREYEGYVEMKNSGNAGLDSVYGSMTTGYRGRVTHRSNIDILRYGKDKNIQHPTQKPVALLERLLEIYSNEGDTVLDFTMGSGSTGVACRRSKRKFIGIEMDPKYFKIAHDRIRSKDKGVLKVSNSEGRRSLF